MLSVACRKQKKKDEDTRTELSDGKEAQCVMVTRSKGHSGISCLGGEQARLGCDFVRFRIFHWHVAGGCAIDVVPWPCTISFGAGGALLQRQHPISGWLRRMLALRNAHFRPRVLPSFSCIVCWACHLPLFFAGLYALPSCWTAKNLTGLLATRHASPLSGL